jgi:hypothetical protein
MGPSTSCRVLVSFVEFADEVSFELRVFEHKETELVVSIGQMSLKRGTCQNRPYLMSLWKHCRRLDVMR